MSEQAEVSVSLEGGDQVKRALQELAGALQKVTGETEKASKAGGGLGESAKKASTFWKDAGKDIVSSLSTMTTAAVGAVTALQTISFSQAITQAKSLDDTFARFSAGSGRAVGDLRQQVRTLSLATNTQEKDVLAWAKAIGRVTYDSKNASNAYQTFFNEAIATNQDMGEQGGIAKLLMGDLQMTGGEADKFLKQLHGMSDLAGNSGGWAAFKDQMEGLGGAMSTLSLKTNESKTEFAALMSALASGKTPQQAARIQQGMIANLQGKGEGLARQFGYNNVYDKDGQMQVTPFLLKKIRDDLTKRYGGRENAIRVARQGNNFGPELASALFDPELDNRVAKAEGAKGSDASKKATDKYLDSDEARRAKNDLIRQQTMEDTARKTFGVQDSLGDFAAEHPLLYGAGATILGLGGKALLGAGAKALFGGGTAAAAGGGGAAATTAAGTGLLTGGGAVATGLGVGAAGILGSMLALGATVNPLNEKMPQIREETQGQLEGHREGLARAVVAGVERGGAGGAEGVEAALGPATLGAVRRDPALSSLLDQFEQQSATIEGLPKNIGDAVAEALKGSPLAVRVINNTGGPVAGAAEVQSKNTRQE